PRRGSRCSRSDARAHLCRPHRLCLVLRQAVRHRREAQRRSPACARLRDRPGREGGDDQAAAERQIPRRREARRGCGEILARAPHDHDRLGPLDRVEVVDPLTIKLDLKTPFAPLIAQLTDRAGMMVSPKAARAAGDKFGLSPICAGPYRFVERVPQGRIVGEKFADYWNKDNVHIGRVVYLPIVEDTVRIANLKSGGLDLIERVLATDIKDVRSDPKLKLATALGLGYMGIDINVGSGERAKNPLGGSAKVRQALDYAIDREALNQVVFNGEFVPGNQWVNPENSYYQKALPVRKRDVNKAKALLKDAGITAPFDVDFMVIKGAESQAVAEVIQAMAADVGINMRIRVTEFATSLKQAEAGEYQAFLLGWSGRTDPDGNVYAFHRCKAP